MESMQGQAIKIIRAPRAVHHVLLCGFVAFAIMFSFVSAANSAADDETAATIDAFYAKWIDVQQSNIPTLKKWLSAHLDKNSEITFEVTAKAPALLDYKFHKTLKADAQKAEEHLIQWLNIHKNSALSYDVKQIKENDETLETEVHYIAHGVTVLPNGRHKTVRLKTDIEIVCLDTLSKPPHINVMRADCALMATSAPLRSLK